MPDYIRSVVKCGRLTQLVSKPNTVSYVQLEAPLHLMQKGARDARGLRPSATCAFKPLDNLVLPKDACSSFGNVLFDIGEMPLYGGRVHDNTYNRPRLTTRALLDRRDHPSSIISRTHRRAATCS
jgi:hypothetical protein